MFKKQSKLAYRVKENVRTMPHELENISKTMAIITMKHIEILAFIGITTKMKNSLKSLIADLGWQKNKSAYLKIGQLRLSTLGKKRKNKEQLTEPHGPVGNHQV